jgi:hypothetical protein
MDVPDPHAIVHGSGIVLEADELAGRVDAVYVGVPHDPRHVRRSDAGRSCRWLRPFALLQPPQRFKDSEGNLLGSCRTTRTPLNAEPGSGRERGE